MTPHKNSSRALSAFLAVCLAAALCLAAGCTPAGSGDATATPETNAETVPELILIAPTDALSFNIVRADEAGTDIRSAASRIATALRDAGADISITTDWERNPVCDNEIIIGQTTRPTDEVGLPTAEELGEKGFIIKAHGGKIYIFGADGDGTVTGVEYFITDIMSEMKDGILSIPGDFEYISTARPLHDISVGGVSLRRGYVIVADATEEGTLAGDAAQTLRRGLLETAGISLTVVDAKTATATSTAIYLKTEPDETKKASFSINVGNGSVTVSGGVDVGMSRGIRAFIDRVLLSPSALEKGVFDMANGYTYALDYDEYVTYERFGAAGDGKTDDWQALAAAHEYANQNGKTVLAREGATYFIGGKNNPAIKIQTDTDFSTARFIIDDVNVENRGQWIFAVTPSGNAISLTGKIGKLTRSADNIGITLPSDCVVILTDSGVVRYIRSGGNQNNGSSQTDVILVSKDGKISSDAPLIWDFDNVTSAVAYPVDEKVLTVRGGIFTTVANRDKSEYNYYARGISVSRSNTVIDGMTHYVTGEGGSGAPYSGFIGVTCAANVTLQNCIFTGHKTYSTIGSGGTSVSMGTYDLNASSSVNVSFLNCRQTNDITDTNYWGILGSNYCKNLVYDGCEFSRFDAHMGVANATIKNSVMGHQGINLIGSGTALIENSVIKSSNFVNLRSDYGSTWEGTLIIRNCKYYPTKSSAVIIGGSNDGTHDFGYTCYLPETVEIDGLEIFGGGTPYLFSAMNGNWTSENYKARYPMVLPKNITVRGLVSSVGHGLVISQNKYMFAGIEIKFVD